MKRLTMLLAGPVLALTLGAAGEPAAAPDRPLPDAAQEARARKLFVEVRCVVCQHESIADSPAGVAADMRQLVREQVASGASDEAVRADLVRRYGDYVLFRPPFRLTTALLWGGPFLLVLLAGALILRAARRRADPAAELLSEDEEARLAILLRERALSDEVEKLRRDDDATSPQDGR